MRVIHGCCDLLGLKADSINNEMKLRRQPRPLAILLVLRYRQHVDTIKNDRICRRKHRRRRQALMGYRRTSCVHTDYAAEKELLGVPQNISAAVITLFWWTTGCNCGIFGRATNSS